MLDLNDALMRRIKLTPVKRKRVPSPSKKVSSATASSKNGVTKLLQFSKPLDVLSLPTTSTTKPTKPKVSGPSSPQPSTASSCFFSPQTTAPTTQAYIDLGQKGFGKHITCHTCGLLYTAGEEEDEREHKRFCRERQRGITIMTKWKNERMLRSFADEDARILEIRAADAPLHVKKLLEVKELLDDALGFVSKDVFLQRGHFLFIQAKQVVGCVTVERIERAVVLETEPSKTTPSTQIKTEQPADQHVDVPAVLGVCQIWVHPDFRGKRIATRLVDVVCEKFIYGLRIPKNRIAFAQPTRNGLAFATSFVTPHRVLVYDGVAEPNKL